MFKWTSLNGLSSQSKSEGWGGGGHTEFKDGPPTHCCLMVGGGGCTGRGEVVESVSALYTHRNISWFKYTVLNGEIFYVWYGPHFLVRYTYFAVKWYVTIAGIVCWSVCFLDHKSKAEWIKKAGTSEKESKRASEIVRSSNSILHFLHNSSEKMMIQIVKWLSKFFCADSRSAKVIL